MQPANILKISSLGNGWRDKDSVLLHACFQLLSDFVEQEIPKYPFINCYFEEMGGADAQERFLLELQSGRVADWDVITLQSENYNPFLDQSHNTWQAFWQNPVF